MKMGISVETMRSDLVDYGYTQEIRLDWLHLCRLGNQIKRFIVDIRRSEETGSGCGSYEIRKTCQFLFLFWV